MVNSNKLRGRITEKFGSQANFAKAWGKASSYVSDKLSGKIAMTYDDIIEWSELLEIASNEIGDYFFAK